ncbi:hypothetical protein [Lichenicoccus roseus]|uniref:Uncharacterized protein n=1 Tax=Lichenicoccus roseus TaxID=2683649 RepID=A0A5R9J8X6_9PROT|nr:hypothetical protein [Lichenicoccus roseus]TLU73439.1 hypothetical protein FE263_08600 [Lichenicoccus roseus]
MSDKASQPAGPDTEHPHNPEEPGGHSETNRPGMTNGVPDDIDQGSASAHPTSDREQSETAAGQPGAQEDPGEQVPGA